MEDMANPKDRISFLISPITGSAYIPNSLVFEDQEEAEEAAAFVSKHWGACRVVEVDEKGPLSTKTWEDGNGIPGSGYSEDPRRSGVYSAGAA